MPGPDPRVEGRWLDRDQWPARARRFGPLRYSDLGRRALEPLGSDEVGPVRAWLSGFADRCWEQAGRPDPFTVVVVSGDDGTLAQDLLAGPLLCRRALRYVLVDPDRADAGGSVGAPPEMARRVPLENPAYLYPSAPPAGTPGSESDLDGDADLEAGEPAPAQGVGPLATFLTEVPGLGEYDGVLVALETLSRLPFDLFQWDGARWCEVRLAAGDGAMEEVEVELPDGARLPPGPAGRTSRHRVPVGATEWLRAVLAGFAGRRLAVVDRWGDGLDPDRLLQVRQPEAARPEPVAGTSMSVVTWRLG